MGENTVRDNRYPGIFYAVIPQQIFLTPNHPLFIWPDHKGNKTLLLVFCYPCHIQPVIAFAFNAKSFAIAILVFFFFFSFSPLFLDGLQKLFSQHFNFSYQENVRPIFDLFLGHTKTYFRKNVSWSCYSRRVWHMTRLICTVTSMHSIQKSTRNCQNRPPKTRKKVIRMHNSSRWHKIRCNGQNRERSSW